MSIASLSFTLVNTYAPLSARPVAASDTKSAPPPAAQEDNKVSGEQRPSGGENRMVLAIMSALREIGLVSQAAPAAASAVTTAPATAKPAATATAMPATAAASSTASTSQAAATTPATDATSTPNTATSTDAASAATSSATDSTAAVESAVHQFAHELFSAMRHIGRGTDGDQDDHGEGHRRNHEHHHRHGHRYGDMSQRLEALAQTVGGAGTCRGDRRYPDQCSSVIVGVDHVDRSRRPGRRDHPGWDSARHTDSSFDSIFAAASYDVIHDPDCPPGHADRRRLPAEERLARRLLEAVQRHQAPKRSHERARHTRQALHLPSFTRGGHAATWSDWHRADTPDRQSREHHGMNRPRPEALQRG